ncbi:hypothetical protein ManeNPV_00101 [Malacosoma neustria nucleopolyhedrovirus]|uniref:hypothetical protein n=1 Tax=Malacosoma neustria nuclear polyhedrosis virus TaxID=38012 RepID=UPI000E35E563|nr:hypothetical protein ManeNPV_00101 [Malacosoma neustria nucleopolyhedrovirus]AUF81627.1 hypothetical protein ManeNPV_00101 [Malacosoma neustria nucleopolyhedrovirus]
MFIEKSVTCCLERIRCRYNQLDEKDITIIKTFLSNGLFERNHLLTMLNEMTFFNLSVVVDTFKWIIWSVVENEYIKNSKLKVLSLRKQKLSPLNVSTERIGVNDKEWKRVLKSIYIKHYLYEMTDDIRDDQYVIDMLYKLSEHLK